MSCRHPLNKQAGDLLLRCPAAWRLAKSPGRSPEYACKR
jgi:hypothetical protein